MPLKKTTKEAQKPDTVGDSKVLAERIKQGLKTVAEKKSSPKDENQPKRLPFRRFFNDVRADPEVVKEALTYYDDAVEDGMKHILHLRGNLDDLLLETPGLAYYYRGIRTDAQQLRRWAEKVLENKKASLYKWFHGDPDAIKKYGKFKTATEINKFVDAEEDVQYLVILVRDLAEDDHRLEDLMEGFEERRLTLSRLIEIRKEGLKEVWIDVGVGDDNT